MRRPFAPFALALSLALLCSAGCGSKKGMFPGEVRQARPGMTTTQVEDRIGPPAYVIEGEDLRMGRDTWVYKTGYLVMHRQAVRSVVPVADPADLPKRQPMRSIAGSTQRLDPFADDDDYYRHTRTRSKIGVTGDQMDNTPMYFAQ